MNTGMLIVTENMLKFIVGLNNVFINVCGWCNSITEALEPAWNIFSQPTWKFSQY